MRSTLAALAALIATGCVNGAARPAPREVAVLKHDIFSQCPLAVAHPSVLLVRARDVWARMLAEARTAPPPYDAGATNFGQRSILIVALPSTPAPTTVVSLPKEGAVFWADQRRLEVRVSVAEPLTPPGVMLPTVVGSPCVVAWLRALDNVDQIVVRTVDGKVLAEFNK